MRDWLRSRKVKTFLFGLVATSASIGLRKFGVLDPDELHFAVTSILGLGGALLGGQALAGMGKEKARILTGNRFALDPDANLTPAERPSKKFPPPPHPTL